MSDPAKDPKSDGDAQRDALAESEKKANEQQPRNWKEDALTDKRVEIKPDQSGKASIRGLDPKGGADKDRPG